MQGVGLGENLGREFSFCLVYKRKGEPRGGGGIKENEKLERVWEGGGGGVREKIAGKAYAWRKNRG